MALRPQQYRLQYPLTAAQVEAIDTMFETLFRSLRNAPIGGETGLTGTPGREGTPGRDGADGRDGGFVSGDSSVFNGSGIAGSVLFVGPSSQIAQDTVNLVYNDATNKLTTSKIELLFPGAEAILLANIGGIAWYDSLAAIHTILTVPADNNFYITHPGIAGKGVFVQSGGQTVLAIKDDKNLLVGGAGGTVTQPTSGRTCIIIGDDAAPSGMASNTAGLYADDVSGITNLFSINEADEVRQISGSALSQIRATGRATAQTAANASVSTYTVGATDASFTVSANVNVTTSTTHNFTVEVSYTDETNTARVLTLTFSSLAGVLLTAITNVTGAGPYHGGVFHLRAKATTAITVATVGTFTTVTYNVEGLITQVAS